MAATFHPELSPDRRVHKLFVDTVIASLATRFAPATRLFGAEHEEFVEICDRSTDKCVFDHLARILVRPIMGGSNLYSTEALNARHLHARPSGN